MSTDKKNNLISVIIPAYNVEDYLERCLRSILRQSYQELEIIVIDDGSEDGTLSVAEKMSALDARIQVIHQDNGGVTRARMRGAADKCMKLCCAMPQLPGRTSAAAVIRRSFLIM